MIQSNLIHKVYCLALEEQIKEVEFNLNSAISNFNKFVNLLTKNKELIDSTLNLKLDKILEFNKIDLDNLKYPISNIYSEQTTTKYKAIQYYITNAFNTKKIIIKNKKYLKDLKNQLIDYTLFNIIIKKFNTKVSEEIIYNNYKFSMDKTFGYLGVTMVESKRKRVDWGKSNKNKAELLSKGLIPYLKKDAESIENYQGVEWLEYHPSKDFVFYWNTTFKYNNNYNFLLKQFSFKPARQGSSKAKAITTKLQEVKQNRDYAFKLYTT